MPRRKSSLSEKTVQAKRKTIARRNETNRQRQIRLSQARLNIRNIRQQEVENALIPWRIKSNSALNYNPQIDYKNNADLNCGPLNIICSYCGALKWKGEPNGMCCQGGKIKLETIHEPPEPLLTLLNGQHPLSNRFMQNIRAYNSAFQMTSFGAKRVNESNFMPTFKVQGQVYHLIGSVEPASGNNHKFLQIYFLGDHEQQVSARLNNFSNLNRALVSSLQHMLISHNSYLVSFKSALDSLPENTVNYNIVIHANRPSIGQHIGRYNAPTTNEVAVLIEGQQFDKRDIIIQKRDNTKQKVSEIHRSYDALQYPLMFCRGEDGYHISIPQVNSITNNNLGKTVSCMNFYAYRMMIRQGEFNTLLRYRMLLNQFWVDQYAKIETERLNYIKLNQKKLRAENYIHLQDALRADENPENLGRLVILPASFVGCPRYLHEKTQDSMTYVKNFGRPDLFITFTCNPNWPEIKNELFHNTSPNDRYDLISRVFRLKVQQLMHLITKKLIFGPIKCFMYTVEWQKRGLPHIHLLLWLENKIRPDEINNVISAEIPNEQTDPELYVSVIKNMVHGPCGNLNNNLPCMESNKCKKKFPKTFSSETTIGNNSYPNYRRRAPNSGGYEAVLRNGIKINNSWIVPYNKVLLRAFDAHINVEYCSSVKAIKYVCKYINKGSDQATFCLNNRDEVIQFQSGRYISTAEAVWRILSFDIHKRSPSVMHLAVHLENGQRVYFNSENLRDRIDNPKDTTLTAFFKLCCRDSFAKTLTYNQIPPYYTWKNNSFERRKQGKTVEGYPGIKKNDTLGRVYTIHPTSVECFHLRILLHTIKGPTSFESLRTVNSCIYDTYKSACKALGLIEDDDQWKKTMKEASEVTSASSLRHLFATILIFCNVADPMSLWTSYREALSEDIHHRLLREHSLTDLPFDNEIFNFTLSELQNIIYSYSDKSLVELGLPNAGPCDNLQNGVDYLREISYDRQYLIQIINRNEGLLNFEQKHVYEVVQSSILNSHGKIFFLDAPGGTGKTFLINLLLAKIRFLKKIAVAVASSGIAATLLDGGRTAHATFKLPLNSSVGSESVVCNIPKQSSTAKLLSKCELIVWDECTMANKVSVEALDRSLKDIHNNNLDFGGVTMLFAGDFRQTLPVIPRGTRADQVNACLKRSLIWCSVNKLSLKINMRTFLNNENRSSLFPDLLIKIGNGHSDLGTSIKLSDLNICSIVKSRDDLIDKVYPNIQSISSIESSFLRERVILAATNDLVNAINNQILDKFFSQEFCYKSVDRTLDKEDAVHYPIEFLNNLNPPGMPSHELRLKVGMPVILLRNLSPPKLCNGTRLLIKTLKQFVIECNILTGCGTGEIVLIPRIPMIPNDLPFNFQRLQFPLNPCFAMTINKAQGQTLSVVGVDLSTSCFSHGQLYVAFSRVSASQNLFVFAPPKDEATNVVYTEALN